MSVKDKRYIEVFNYEPNVVTVVGANTSRPFTFEAYKEDRPSVVPMTLEDIEYINSYCDIFRNGVLRFSKADERELYEILGIDNIDNILFIEKIDEMLKHPSMDNYKFIVQCIDMSVVSRIRGEYYGLISVGADITEKYHTILDTRYDELSHGKRASAIALPKEETVENNAELDELKSQLAEKDKQFAEMQAMMEKLMQAQKVSSQETEKVPENSEEKVESPKRGRPAKK